MNLPASSGSGAANAYVPAMSKRRDSSPPSDADMNGACADDALATARRTISTNAMVLFIAAQLRERGWRHPCRVRAAGVPSGVENAGSNEWIFATEATESLG